MSKRATRRKRCSECRAWFTPTARLAKQQRVCGSACRLGRRRKQARRRRAAAPVDFRDEERERKRRSRLEARRAGARAVPKCAQMTGSVGTSHGPGEACKARESLEQFAKIWNSVWDLSRTGWEREARRIAREVWKKSRQGRAAGGDGHGPGAFPNL